LFVNYFFPPVANSGTFRPMKFARYLPQFGWDPVVVAGALTPADRVDESLLDQLPPDLDVTRAPLDADVAAAWCSRLVRRVADERRVYEGLAWRLRGLREIPDPYASWQRPAVAAGMRAYARHPFDVVFASGYPWSSLVIGRTLACRLRLPLVAEFRDPWTADDVLRGPLSPRAERAHRRLERLVIDQAAAVVSVNDHLSDSLQALGARRVVTSPNGFDVLDSSDVTPDPKRAGRLRVVYTGVWKDGYGPDQLYEAVSRLAREAPALASRLDVVTAGFPPGPAEAMGISHIVTELGSVPHGRSLSIMRSADVLVLPVAGGSHRQLQVPGKLYEYLASGSPVLAMTDPRGAAGAVIARVGGGVCTPADDLGALTATLASALSQGHLAVPPVKRDVLMEYDRRTLTSKLAQVFESVAGS
jgi:glycosyltransferase involved in cell wall biosynthesis